MVLLPWHAVLFCSPEMPVNATAKDEVGFVILKLLLDISKNMLSFPLTMMRCVVPMLLGIVITSLPSFGTLLASKIPFVKVLSVNR